MIKTTIIKFPFTSYISQKDLGHMENSRGLKGGMDGTLADIREAGGRGRRTL